MVVDPTPLMIKYLGGKPELANYERELLLFALYIESASTPDGLAAKARRLLVSSSAVPATLDVAALCKLGSRAEVYVARVMPTLAGSCERCEAGPGVQCIGQYGRRTFSCHNSRRRSAQLFKKASPAEYERMRTEQYNNALALLISRLPK